MISISCGLLCPLNAERRLRYEIQISIDCLIHGTSPFRKISNQAS
nr:MAG TPA: hypothetical protein [Caudoviricetes sp.]